MNLIAQNSLQRYHLLKERRLDLDRQARELEKKEKEFEKEIMSRLKKKQKVEPGAFTARIDYGGRYPSWKKVCEDKLGTDFCEEVIANTPAKEVLVIEAV